MDRLIATNSVPYANRDVAPVSGTPQYATDGTPGVTPATLWPSYAFNMLQDELMAVILAAGITPDDTNWGQLLQAIRTLGRIKLTGNLNIYVATTGSDTANTGLTSGSPFATLQHAWDVLVADYDLGGYTATINLAAGTYAAGLTAAPPTVGGSVVVLGNAGSPGTVTISVAAGNCISILNGDSVTLNGMTLTTAGGSPSACVNAQNGSTVAFENIVFGAAYYHLQASIGSQVVAIGDYTISGSAAGHLRGHATGVLQASGVTVTLTGTPAFSVAFAIADECGVVEATSTTFTGSATGARYSAVLNGVVQTNGGGATYFPGSSGGTSATGGQYA
jgi:hypothetical protein